MILRFRDDDDRVEEVGMILRFKDDDRWVSVPVKKIESIETMALSESDKWSVMIRIATYHYSWVINLGACETRDCARIKAQTVNDQLAMMISKKISLSICDANGELCFRSM